MIQEKGGVIWNGFDRNLSGNGNMHTLEQALNVQGRIFIQCIGYAGGFALFIRLSKFSHPSP